MQEKLGGGKCSQELEGFSSPDTLSPTRHCPISLSSVYPPWTQATESPMLSSCNEAIAFKPQIQTTWRESPGLPPVVLVRPSPSPTPTLHRRVFFPISQAILLGSLSHSPESLIVWAVSFHTLGTWHHQPQRPTHIWGVPIPFHSSHQQILPLHSNLRGLGNWTLISNSSLST